MSKPGKPVRLLNMDDRDRQKERVDLWAAIELRLKQLAPPQPPKEEIK